MQTQTETVSVTTVVPITGAVWPESAAEILLMQTEMGSVIIMQPGRATALRAAGIILIQMETASVITMRLANVRAADTDAAADVETVSVADAADNRDVWEAVYR